ncbi:MAG: hypothetical protein LBT59_00470 [Clostridiales bacterium]|jgi:hypothetical protein|nr:hypothetical protein [Clostridiales bacterium]
MSFFNIFRRVHATYEFLALDKPLEKADRDKVSKSVAGVASVTSNRASLVFYDDFSGIDFESLMEDHFDLMYNLDAGNWILCYAFPGSSDLFNKLKRFCFDDGATQIADAKRVESRVIVTMSCYLDLDPKMLKYEQQDKSSTTGMFGFMTKIRAQLMNGDFRTLYALWEKYMPEENDEYDDDEEGFIPPPKPNNPPQGRDVVDAFKNMLTDED